MSAAKVRSVCVDVAIELVVSALIIAGLLFWCFNAPASGGQAAAAQPLKIEVVQGGDAAGSIYPGQIIEKDALLANCSESVGAWGIMQVAVPVAKVQTVGEAASDIPAHVQELFSYEVGEGWQEVGEVIKAKGFRVHTYAALDPVPPGGSTPPLYDSITFADIAGDQLGKITSLDFDVTGYGVQESAYPSAAAAYEDYAANSESGLLG